ncbi:MAG: hypothetical protein ABI615_01750 [Chthoniobacterales bacterium]
MNASDEIELRELQHELLASGQSPWEPQCVARAFCSTAAGEPFVFTMQAWIDLEAAQSPLLQGTLPPGETALDDFATAFRAFGHRDTTPENCEPEELVLLGHKMIRAIREAFAMRLSLEPPDGSAKKSAIADSGMGFWLPVFSCLTSQLGFSRADALATPVPQAFALIASHRVNQGWSVAGETYALRDCGETVIPQSETTNPETTNAG